MSEPIYYESKVAELLGLTREDLRYFRYDLLGEKKGGGAWRREGRAVVLTQSGIDQILTHLRASHNATPPEIDLSSALVEQAVAPGKKEGDEDQPSEPHDEPPPALPAKPALVTLTVIRCYPNPRMIKAADPEGRVVDVRVKTNRNFVPQMKLQGRLVTVGKYEMEGRCPRTRGRY